MEVGEGEEGVLTALLLRLRDLSGRGGGGDREGDGKGGEIGRRHFDF